MWNWARLAVLVYPKSSQGFLHTFSMALYHKWDVKKCLCLCTSILSLIFGGLRGVHNHRALSSIWKKIWGPNVLLLLNHKKKFILIEYPFIFQVSWVRYRDTSLLSVGKFVYISDRRFKVLHEVNSSDWFLVIKSVTYNDQGIYECQVNSDPYRTFKFHLSVVGEYFCFFANFFFFFLVHISEKTFFDCKFTLGFMLSSPSLITTKAFHTSCIGF